MSKARLLLISLFLFVSFHLMAKGNRDFEITLTGTKEASHVLACNGPEFSFHFPQMAGNFRLGIANGKNSLWTSELKKVSVENNKGKLAYILKDPLLGNGIITVRATGLSSSNGIILEIEADNIPDSLQLIWSFGGCYGKELEDKTNSKLEPAYCKYNVFSVEGTAFTTYYGESMRLRTIHGVTPLESVIRLCDANQQQSPLAFFHSGKQTDSPALGATTLLKNGRKLYFCFYTQNREADYNYYMLPKLFEHEFNN